MGILDLFFPKRCVNCRKFGAYVCPNCFVYISFDVLPICLVCNRQTYTSLTHERCQGKYGIDGAFASVVFGRVVRKLIYQFKYRPYLHDLQSFIVDLFYEGIIQKEAFFSVNKQDALLIPIPLHPSRLRSRGYNQSLLLAQALGEKLQMPVKEVLVRTKQTKQQFTLSKKERDENLKGAFALKKDGTEKLTGRTLFLVDDVLTSGATLLEAANVLKKHDAAKVYGLTLAHGN